MSVYPTNHFLYTFSILALLCASSGNNVIEHFLNYFSFENVYYIILLFAVYGLLFLLSLVAIYHLVISVISPVATSYEFITPTTNTNAPRIKNHLTESMKIISNWIDKIEAKKLRTIIPTFASEREQTKISRLVIIELFKSYRISRLQCLLNIIICDTDKDTKELMNALSTIVLLALDITPTECPKQDYMRFLISTALLLSPREFVFNELLYKLEPFTKTEKKLMQDMGYDLERYIYSKNEDRYREIEYNRFKEKNIFMKHPYEYIDPSSFVLSKSTLRIFQYMKDLNPSEFRLKLKSVEKNITKVETDIKSLIHSIRKEVVKLYSLNANNMDDFTSKINDKYEKVMTINIMRKRYLLLQNQVKEILNRKVVIKWNNAIVEASIMGLNPGFIYNRVCNARISYLDLIDMIKVFDNLLLIQEENVSIWLLPKLNHCIQAEFEVVDSW